MISMLEGGGADMNSSPIPVVRDEDGVPFPHFAFHSSIAAARMQRPVQKSTVTSGIA
jgi:hypothetical protein